MNTNVTETQDALIEAFGLMAQEDGLPRIAGRIHGLFLVQEEERSSLADIAERLKVSRGSVSTNLRLLESVGVLQRSSLPGDRHVYYRLNADPYAHMLERHVRRLNRFQDVVDKASLELPGSQVRARARLGEMNRFFSGALEGMNRLLAEWRQRHDASHRKAG
jgi:DNA-binding transcriptional regulator GbsR (MarR family)